MERNLRQEIRVGLFVVAILVLLGVVTWVINGGADALKPRYTLNAYYVDVKGLKKGAVVRLAGIDVGSVARIELAPDVPGKNVHVAMTIRQEFQEKITESSVANMTSVGVLGDEILNLSVGDPARRKLVDGDTIGTSEASDVMGQLSAVGDKISTMLGTDEEAKQAKISSSLAHVEQLLADAKDGQGLVHTLVYDPAAGEKLNGILDKADGVMDDVHSITGEVRHGDGLAHALIYDKGGEKLVKNVVDLSGQVGGLVDDLKTKDSLAHALLYDPEQKRMVDDLRQLASNLRSISGQVEDGEGTVGLLVRDPQLYEDLRLLFGGAQRNALLRAYVRSTVARSRDEQGTGLPPSDNTDLNGR